MCILILGRFSALTHFTSRPQVYRSSNPGLALRLYLLLHGETSEEHKYLVGLRREKDSFERLIKQHAVSGFHTIALTMDLQHWINIEYAHRFRCASVICRR
jgi:hypothetical protein